MMKKLFRKYLLLIVAIIAVIAVVVPVAAYEGHLIDIKAHLTLDTATICELGFTRTPGYWSTHVEAANYVLTVKLGGSIDMGWPSVITNINDLEGIFWANTAKDSNGDNRDPLCKSKVKCAAQVLSAILTAATPNGGQLPVSITDIRATMSRTDAGAKDAVDALQSLLDTFNNSNDFGSLGLPGGIENNSMGGDDARAMSNIPFADCP